MKISAIIPAAGTGSRYSQDKNKLLENLGGTPVIAKTLLAISNVKDINEVIICTSVDIIDEITQIVEKYNISNVSKIILGGETRQESVRKGLEACSAPDFVLIHDGARPLISHKIIEESILAAKQHGASIVGVRAKDTIKAADEFLNVKLTLNRSELWQIQTPQVFNHKKLYEVHQKYVDFPSTDDASLMEHAGMSVKIVEGEYKNIKITTPEDLLIARALSDMPTSLNKNV